MQYTKVSPVALVAHMTTIYGRICAQDLELINIARPWNPGMDIKTVFKHGALCRKLAAEGGNPIMGASYVLILVKIFQESVVFPMEIREWSCLQEANKHCSEMHDVLHRGV